MAMAGSTIRVKKRATERLIRIHPTNHTLIRGVNRKWVKDSGNLAMPGLTFLPLAQEYRMAISVTCQLVKSRTLAAVRRQVASGSVGAAWRPALDLVWQFLRRQPGLHAGGHNVFLYRHPESPGLPIIADFGVEVTRSFPPEGEVREILTPEGEAAVGVHLGPYDHMGETHNAIRAFVAAQQRVLAGQSWEIYGDWTDDASKLEVTIVYLLR
jgi:hypothetical protein